MEVCPSDCSQKQSCQRINETLGVVKIIKNKLGERSKVFEGIEVVMIGSTREGSRVFFNDEVDTHLTLNNDLKQFCYFDVNEHALMKRDPSPGTVEMPDDIAKYFDDRKVFKTEQYFFDFVASVHSIISTLDLPCSKFSMRPLSASFDPCTKCMTSGLRGLQDMR